jgi:hypothetical protein
MEILFVQLPNTSIQLDVVKFDSTVYKDVEFGEQNHIAYDRLYLGRLYLDEVAFTLYEQE